VTDFEMGEHRWIDRLGNLRNVIRQEIIARQLAPFAADGMTVLDVGCGQGTQALLLASGGCHVTGVDPSPELLRLCAQNAAAEHLVIDLVQGRIENLAEILAGQEFDLVCCHGVMMYMGDRRSMLQNLADRLVGGGHLSVTFRNAHALAMRPGLRRDWVAAISAFESRDYVNDLGLKATADRLEDIDLVLGYVGLDMVGWWGVRVFNDAISTGTAPPDQEELLLLFDAEEKAGSTDPYRWMASQLHVVASAASS
jgi:S-adenosylmethionine-dependent methyltransferase